jgi:glycerol-3-phosphate acyltransferase PlsY
MDTAALALAAASYVSGAVPSGYLIAKMAAGIDIREHGSGNPGAANVYRVVGRAQGLQTLAADSFKGFLPAFIARLLYPGAYDAAVLCGALAIVGHVWTIFLGFKGGKGVATSAGVFLAVLPIPLLCSAAVFSAATALSGHISAGSIAAAAALPIFSVALQAPAPLRGLAFAASALVLVRHIPNLICLLRGEPIRARGKKGLEKSSQTQ